MFRQRYVKQPTDSSTSPPFPQHNYFEGCTCSPLRPGSTTIFDPKFTTARSLLITAWLNTTQLSRHFHILRGVGDQLLTMDVFLERAHKNLEMTSWRPLGNNSPRWLQRHRLPLLVRQGQPQQTPAASLGYQALSGMFSISPSSFSFSRPTWSSQPCLSSREINGTGGLLHEACIQEVLVEHR